MFKTLFGNFSYQPSSTADAENIRHQLQAIFFKIKTYQKDLFKDNKLNFKVTDNINNQNARNPSGEITFYIGGYVIKYDMNKHKSIQLYRRGKIDNLQFAELLTPTRDKKFIN